MLALVLGGAAVQGDRATARLVGEYHLYSLLLSHAPTAHAVCDDDQPILHGKLVEG